MCCSILKRFYLQWKAFDLLTRWGIFCGWWRYWRPVTSQTMVTIFCCTVDVIFTYRKILPNLVDSSWWRWFLRGILASQKQRKIWNEKSYSFSHLISVGIVVQRRQTVVYREHPIIELAWRLGSSLPHFHQGTGFTQTKSFHHQLGNFFLNLLIKNCMRNHILCLTTGIFFALPRKEKKR